MLKIGLTGGIGCGKSAAVAHFKSHSIPIVDADAIARKVVEPNQPALIEISKQFGKHLLQDNGMLDRAALRQIVFSDPAKLKLLEKITQPHIRQRISQEMLRQHNSPYIIVDIPLLIEKGYKELCDRVIVVDCLPEQQIERVMQRDQSSREMVEKIMHQQMSRAERLSHADDILDNSQTLADLDHAVDQLHISYLTLAARN